MNHLSVKGRMGFYPEFSNDSYFIFTFCPVINNLGDFIILSMRDDVASVIDLRMTTNVFSLVSV